MVRDMNCETSQRVFIGECVGWFGWGCWWGWVCGWGWVGGYVTVLPPLGQW